MASVTAAQARVYIKGLTGTDEDTTIDVLIARADAAIAAWLGYPAASAGGTRDFESATYTHYTNGTPEVLRMDSQRILLPCRPVTSVTSVHDDPDRGYAAGDLVASSDYDVDGEEGTVLLTTTSSHGSFSTARRAVQVIYVAGWATVPVSIQQAVCRLVQHWWRLRAEGGRTSTSAGGKSVALRDETLPEDVVEILAPLRLHGWAI